MISIRRKGPVEADFTKADENLLDSIWARIDKKLKAEKNKLEKVKPKVPSAVRKGKASKRGAGVSRKTV